MPHQVRPTPGRLTVHDTMCEATRIPSAWVAENLRRGRRHARTTAVGVHAERAEADPRCRQPTRHPGVPGGGRRHDHEVDASAGPTAADGFNEVHNEAQWIENALNETAAAGQEASPRGDSRPG